MNPNTERGLLLFQQGRYDLAIQEFQQVLAANPQDGFALACTALCLAKQQKYSEASQSAARAIESEPDLAFAHYAAASVFHDRNRTDEAERAINEAIRLFPYEASYHGLAAIIRFDRSDWRGGLERATTGLEIDPDDAMCTNVRAMALMRLGQADHARTELEASRSRDPENATTHANLGWEALGQGEREQAMESFREALRISPDLEWARSGMIHALKLRYPLYGLFLKYLLWMQTLQGRARWGVIVGGYIAFRAVRELARRSPDLAPWLTPLLIAYIAFVYMTWIARPLTNLALRLNRFGRAALDDDERRESNLVGVTLLIGLGAGVIYLVTGSTIALITLLLAAALVIPFSTVYQCPEGWPRKASTCYAVAMTALAAAVLATFVAPEFVGDLTLPLLSIFGIGAIAAPWVSNALVMTRPKI